MQSNDLGLQEEATQAFDLLRVSVQLYFPSLLHSLPAISSKRGPGPGPSPGPAYSLTWQDIIGQEDAKRSLYECCLLPSLLPASLFVGCRQLCTSVLLYGPPGTGKTSLVRAAASESRSFSLFFLPLDRFLLELSPSACLSKWSGEAERRLRRAFGEARSRAPSLLFFDELDALSLDRAQTDDSGARRLLSELLIQLSALQSDDHVIVIAATNRIADIDPAVLRRFEKTIEVPLPSTEERAQIVAALLRGVACAIDDDDLASIAEATEGWSGSLLRVGGAEGCGVEPLSRGSDDSAAGGVPESRGGGGGDGRERGEGGDREGFRRGAGNDAGESETGGAKRVMDRFCCCLLEREWR